MNRKKEDIVEMVVSDVGDGLGELAAKGKMPSTPKPLMQIKSNQMRNRILRSLQAEVKSLQLKNPK